MTEYRTTVAAHVIWHPACDAGGAYARALFAQLFEDPEDLGAHGLRIPVRLWRSAGDPDTRDLPPPGVPPLADATRTVVIVLVDKQFLAAPGWSRLLDDLAAAARTRDVMIAVSLDEIVMEVKTPLFERNLVRLHEVDPPLRETFLLNRVTHALCRLVAGSPEPVKVFISHAKKDGLPIAKAVRRFLHEGSGLRDFFDAQDLLEGSTWQEQIRGEAARNVLLAVRTDAYASREWCRTEILEAKLAGSPIVVLDALKSFEARGFPYLGNGPSVRWTRRSPAAFEELLRVVLYETLRFRYFPLRVADLCRAYHLPSHDHIFTAPPELLTVLRRKDFAPDAPPLVYPDPPLGTDELKLVNEFAPGLGMITPTALIAGR